MAEAELDKAAIYATKGRRYSCVLDAMDDVLNSEKPTLLLETVSITI